MILFFCLSVPCGDLSIHPSHLLPLPLCLHPDLPGWVLLWSHYILGCSGPRNTDTHSGLSIPFALHNPGPCRHNWLHPVNLMICSSHFCPWSGGFGLMLSLRLTIPQHSTVTGAFCSLHSKLSLAVDWSFQVISCRGCCLNTGQLPWSRLWFL